MSKKIKEEEVLLNKNKRKN